MIQGIKIKTKTKSYSEQNVKSALNPQSKA